MVVVALCRHRMAFDRKTENNELFLWKDQAFAPWILRAPQTDELDENENVTPSKRGGGGLPKVRLPKCLSAILWEVLCLCKLIGSLVPQSRTELKTLSPGVS